MGGSEEDGEGVSREIVTRGFKRVFPSVGGMDDVLEAGVVAILLLRRAFCGLSLFLSDFFSFKTRWECHNRFNSTSRWIRRVAATREGRLVSDQDGLLLGPTSSCSFI